MPSTPESTRHGRTVVLFAGLVTAAYALSLFLMPRDGFWSGDSGCKFLQLQGILRTGEFSIAWPGQRLDPEFAFVPLRKPFGHVVDGKLYAQYSPVFALASAIPYRLVGFGGLFLLPFLAGLATLPAVWRIAAHLSERSLAPFAAVLVTAFATPHWFYSLTFWEMTPAVCLATWSVCVLLPALARPSARRVAVSGALAGASVYFRDELYLFAFASMVAIVVRGTRPSRSLLVFGGALATALVPLWIFQWVALGNPLGHHFSSVSSGGFLSTPHWGDRAAAFRNLFVDGHEDLAVSALAAAPALLAFVTFPRLSVPAFRRAVPIAAALGVATGAFFLRNHLVAREPLLHLLETNGLFASVPFAMIGFVRLRRDTKGQADGERERAHVALWIVLLVYTGAYAILAPLANTVGIHWGCRFLLAAYPLLGILAAVSVAEWWGAWPAPRRWALVPVGGALVLSVVLQAHSLRLLHHRQALSGRLNRAVAAHTDDVVITTGWAIPQELSQVFYDRLVFLATEQEPMDRLVAMLRRHGYTSALRVDWILGDESPPANGEFIDEPWGFPSFVLRPVRWGGS